MHSHKKCLRLRYIPINTQELYRKILILIRFYEQTLDCATFSQMVFFPGTTENRSFSSYTQIKLLNSILDFFSHIYVYMYGRKITNMIRFNLFMRNFVYMAIKMCNNCSFSFYLINNLSWDSLGIK